MNRTVPDPLRRLMEGWEPTLVTGAFFEPVPVRLLVGPLVLPIVYTKSGHPRKHQPKPMQVGDVVYLKPKWDTGKPALYPFSMAGTGYELVTDAQEGVHYEQL